jgi:hypothetical protein
MGPRSRWCARVVNIWMCAHLLIQVLPSCTHASAGSYVTDLNSGDACQWWTVSMPRRSAHASAGSNSSRTHPPLSESTRSGLSAHSKIQETRTMAPKWNGLRPARSARPWATSRVSRTSRRSMLLAWRKRSQPRTPRSRSLEINGTKFPTSARSRICTPTVSQTSVVPPSRSLIFCRRGDDIPSTRGRDLGEDV